ncbi:MAG TPA: TSUP family transporter [Kofleriaceae bacterium]|nr:TSUP family transporter [Kofleriaceae bacterium]
MTTHELLILSAVLGTGAFVEAVAGFGGTIVALSMGARWFGIETLLAWFLPLNLGLSTALALRGRTAIAHRMLARRILPAVLAGIAAGTALALVIDAGAARGIFAALVILVGAAELAVSVRVSVRRRTAPSPRPEARAPVDGPGQPAVEPTAAMRPAIQNVLLAGAGVVHGVFATGGPLAVAVIGRMLPQKTALRSTLAVMWLVLNVIVCVRLVAGGHLDAHSLAVSLRLAPAMAAGMLTGDLVHRRVGEERFRIVVAVLLLATGGLLLQASLR